MQRTSWKTLHTSAFCDKHANEDQLRRRVISRTSRASSHLHEPHVRVRDRHHTSENHSGENKKLPTEQEEFTWAEVDLDPAIFRSRVGASGH